MTQHEYNAAAVVIFVGLLLIVSLFVLWGGHDKRLDGHDDDLAEFKAWRAANFGPEPRVLVDGPTQPIATDEMPAVSIRDARSAVAAAREANRERPTPFPRTDPAAVTDARESGRRGEPVWGRDRVSPRHRAARGKR